MSNKPNRDLLGEDPDTGNKNYDYRDGGMDKPKILRFSLVENTFKNQDGSPIDRQAFHEIFEAINKRLNGKFISIDNPEDFEDRYLITLIVDTESLVYLESELIATINQLVRETLPSDEQSNPDLVLDAAITPNPTPSPSIEANATPQQIVEAMGGVNAILNTQTVSIDSRNRNPWLVINLESIVAKYTRNEIAVIVDDLVEKFMEKGLLVARQSYNLFTIINLEPSYLPDIEAAIKWVVENSGYSSKPIVVESNEPGQKKTFKEIITSVGGVSKVFNNSTVSISEESRQKIVTVDLSKSTIQLNKNDANTLLDELNKALVKLNYYVYRDLKNQTLKFRSKDGNPSLSFQDVEEALQFIISQVAYDPIMGTQIPMITPSSVSIPPSPSIDDPEETYWESLLRGLKPSSVLPDPSFEENDDSNLDLDEVAPPEKPLIKVAELPTSLDHNEGGLINIELRLNQSFKWDDLVVAKLIDVLTNPDNPTYERVKYLTTYKGGFSVESFNQFIKSLVPLPGNIDDYDYYIELKKQLVQVLGQLKRKQTVNNLSNLIPANIQNKDRPLTESRNEELEVAQNFVQMLITNTNQSLAYTFAQKNLVDIEQELSSANANNLDQIFNNLDSNKFQENIGTIVSHLRANPYLMANLRVYINAQNNPKLKLIFAYYFGHYKLEKDKEFKSNADLFKEMLQNLRQGSFENANKYLTNLLELDEISQNNIKLKTLKGLLKIACSLGNIKDIDLFALFYKEDGNLNSIDEIIIAFNESRILSDLPNTILKQFRNKKEFADITAKAYAIFAEAGYRIANLIGEDGVTISSLEDLLRFTRTNFDSLSLNRQSTEAILIRTLSRSLTDGNSRRNYQYIAPYNSGEYEVTSEASPGEVLKLNLFQSGQIPELIDLYFGNKKDIGKFPQLIPLYQNLIAFIKQLKSSGAYNLINELLLSESFDKVDLFHILTNLREPYLGLFKNIVNQIDPALNIDSLTNTNKNLIVAEMVFEFLKRLGKHDYAVASLTNINLDSEFGAYHLTDTKAIINRNVEKYSDVRLDQLTQTERSKISIEYHLLKQERDLVKEFTEFYRANTVNTSELRAKKQTLLQALKSNLTGISGKLKELLGKDVSDVVDYIDQHLEEFITSPGMYTNGIPSGLNLYLKDLENGINAFDNLIGNIDPVENKTLYVTLNQTSIKSVQTEMKSLQQILQKRVEQGRFEIQDNQIESGIDTYIDLCHKIYLGAKSKIKYGKEYNNLVARKGDSNLERAAITFLADTTDVEKKKNRYALYFVYSQMVKNSAFSNLTKDDHLQILRWIATKDIEAFRSDTDVSTIEQSFNNNNRTQRDLAKNLLNAQIKNSTEVMKYTSENEIHRKLSRFGLDTLVAGLKTSVIAGEVSLIGLFLIGGLAGSSQLETLLLSASASVLGIAASKSLGQNVRGTLDRIRGRYKEQQVEIQDRNREVAKLISQGGNTPVSNVVRQLEQVKAINTQVIPKVLQDLTDIKNQYAAFQKLNKKSADIIKGRDANISIIDKGEQEILSQLNKILVIHKKLENGTETLLASELNEVIQIIGLIESWIKNICVQLYNIKPESNLSVPDAAKVKSIQIQLGKIKDNAKYSAAIS